MDDKRSAAMLDDVHEGDGNRQKGAAGNRDEQPKIQNPRELDEARYAALMSRAHSDQARALVDDVTKRVSAHELAAGKRSNKGEEKTHGIEGCGRALSG